MAEERIVKADEPEAEAAIQVSGRVGRGRERAGVGRAQVGDPVDGA
jgi:hypothetical protein